MDEKNLLDSLNDTKLSEDEIKKYESMDFDNNKLADMENRFEKLYARENFHKCIDEAVKNLEEDEMPQQVLLGSAYAVTGLRVGMGILYRGVSSMPLADWGSKIAVILTNKRLLVIYANLTWQLVSLKNIIHKNIKNIKCITKDNSTIITIHYTDGLDAKGYPNANDVKIVVYNDNYKESLSHLKSINNKISIITTGENIFLKLLKISIWALIIAGALYLIIGCIRYWGNQASLYR